MDYQRIYDSLIERGKNRILKGYSERHHIVPKCLNGSNDRENLVSLTGREHLEAHFLLTMIYPGYRGLETSLFLMLGKRKTNGELTEEEYELYEKLRKQHSKNVSEWMSGENNPMYGRRGKNSPIFGKLKGPMTEETKEKLRGPRGPMSEKHKAKLRGPRPNTRGPYTEERKAKLRKPKSTTINMKGPKTKEHIAKASKARCKSIICTDNGIIYFSAKESAEKLNLCASSITKALKGKYKRTGGYKFEYVKRGELSLS